ncbi:hypothetical protein [Lysobacter sp. CA199]|uniref:hypothetical protein n=1 Tax=Lysobacter sp. CA199 TaxID=3455608 RepID=UPI003F8D8076
MPTHVSARPSPLAAAAGLLAFALPALTAFAQPALPDGSLDPGFGRGGVAISDFPLNNDWVHAVATQPDGKILTFSRGGGPTPHDPTFLRCRLLRWSSDGKLDPTFGNAGQALLSGPRDSAGLPSCTTVAVQSDGKIVVGGTLGFNVLLARYTPDGRLDRDFDDDGIVVTRDYYLNEPYEIAFQPDGRIVVGAIGFDDSSSTFTPAVARFTANGKLDPSFGRGGVAATPLPERFGGGSVRLVLQHDGKIVTAGSVQNASMLIRYLPDGRLDPAFGAGGIVRFIGNNLYDTVNGMVLQADGSFLTSHSLRTFDPGPDFKGTVIRHRADGSLDSGYGSPLVRGSGRLALQADGRVLMLGYHNRSSVMQRINPDGSPDTGFDRPRIDFGGVDGTFQAMAVQGNGAIVLVAWLDDQRIGVARLLSPTYCLADPFNPGRYIGFSDSGWFSTANSGVGGNGYGVVGRGSIQAWNRPGVGQYHRLTASGASPDSVYRVDASVHTDGRSGWGSGNVFANGATPARYATLDARINDIGCSIRSSR